VARGGSGRHRIELMNFGGVDTTPLQKRGTARWEGHHGRGNPTRVDGYCEESWRIGKRKFKNYHKIGVLRSRQVKS